MFLGKLGIALKLFTISNTQGASSCGSRRKAPGKWWLCTPRSSTSLWYLALHLLIDNACDMGVVDEHLLHGGTAPVQQPRDHRAQPDCEYFSGIQAIAFLTTAVLASLTTAVLASLVLSPCHGVGSRT